MSNKLPAFQLYPGDWRKDPGVQALDFEYRGVWFELLLLMHESDQRGKLLLNSKAMPDEAIARLLGLDKQKFSKIKSTLLEYGVASIDEGTGALINRRMVRDEEIRQKRREAGKKGGNPDLLKQKSSKQNNKVNQKGNQSSTPSSSTSFSPSSNNISTKPREGNSEDDTPRHKPGSIEEVAKFFDNNKSTYEEAELFYHHYEEQGWVKGNGMAIVSWHSSAIKWIKKGRNNPKKQKTNGRTKSDRNPNGQTYEGNDLEDFEFDETTG